MTDDDNEDTPPNQSIPSLVVDHTSGGTLTDSQRDWFALRFASRTPAVMKRDTPRPYELMARTTTPDELEVLRRFRLAGSKTELEEFVVKMFAEIRQLRSDLNKKIEADSSDNQEALEKLREVLSKPPNGKLRALSARVDGQQTRIDAQHERINAMERKADERLAALERKTGDADKDADHRIEDLEGDATFARRAAQGVLIFVFTSAAAFGLWLWHTAEESGRQKQRIEDTINKVKELEQRQIQLRWQHQKDNTQ